MDDANRGGSPAAGARDLALSGAPRRPFPAASLPDRQLQADELSTPVWWLGVHGGAGESTLELLLAGTRAAQHAWPVRQDGQLTNVVLVARLSHHGLTSVQAAMRDWNDRHARHINVLGLVLVANRPGRAAKQLKELVFDVEHATRASWSMPWVDAWELGEIPSEINAPRQQVQQLTEGLIAALGELSASTGGSY